MALYRYESDCIRGEERIVDGGLRKFTIVESHGDDLKDLLANGTAGYECNDIESGFVWLMDLPDDLRKKVEREIAEIIFDRDIDEVV